MYWFFTTLTSVLTIMCLITLGAALKGNELAYKVLDIFVVATVFSGLIMVILLYI